MCHCYLFLKYQSFLFLPFTSMVKMSVSEQENYMMEPILHNHNNGIMVLLKIMPHTNIIIFCHIPVHCIPLIIINTLKMNFMYYKCIQKMEKDKLFYQTS